MNHNGAYPEHVRRVLASIDERPQRRWGDADLAEVAGVSIRVLQLRFKRYLGTTPKEYVRNVRLMRARHDLLRASPDDSAVQIMARWRLGHSRFAKFYRLRYGELPSQTLRRTSLAVGFLEPGQVSGGGSTLPSC